MPTTRPGVVSVVLVNFRGTDDTLTAIDHLGRLDWPADRLEIVVVENASGTATAWSGNLLLSKFVPLRRPLPAI